MNLLDIFKNIRKTIQSTHHGGSVITLCHQFDVDRDKRLSLSEFGSMLESLGFDIPKNVLRRLFSVFDVSEEGSITYFQFIKTISYGEGDVGRLSDLWFAPATPREAPRPRGRRGSLVYLDDGHTVGEVVDIIREQINSSDHGGSVITVCKKYDTANDRCLSQNEFGAMLRDLNFEVSDNLVGRLFAVFDKQHRGRIEYFDFIQTISHEKGCLGTAGEKVAFTQTKSPLASPRSAPNSPPISPIGTRSPKQPPASPLRLRATALSVKQALLQQLQNADDF